MTAMTSVEALTGLTEGDQIRVRSQALGMQTWRKREGDLFLRDGVVVPATFFVGYINEGRVTRLDDTPARPGDWFEAGRYNYHMVYLNDEGEGSNPIHALTFHSGVFRSENDYTPDQFDTANNSRMVRVENVPAAVAANVDSVRRLVDAYADRLAVVSTRLMQATERAEQAEADRKPAPEPEPVAEPVRDTIIVAVSGVGIRLEDASLVDRDENDSNEESTVVFSPGPVDPVPMEPF